jgi:hypothetical protein
MTLDFIEDAMSCLEKDEDFNFMLIGGHYNSRRAIARGRVPTKRHLEWLKLRFEEFYEEMKQELPE